MAAIDGSAVLLGMENFVVLASTIVDGEVWMEIETLAAKVACAMCGNALWDTVRSRVWIRDLPSLGCPGTAAVGQPALVLSGQGL